VQFSASWRRFLPTTVCSHQPGNFKKARLQIAYFRQSPNLPAELYPTFLIIRRLLNFRQSTTRTWKFKDH
jgi:hypothetical protein